MPCVLIVMALANSHANIVTTQVPVTAMIAFIKLAQVADVTFAKEREIGDSVLSVRELAS